MKYQIIPPENAGYSIDLIDQTTCEFNNSIVKGNNLIEVLTSFLSEMQSPEISAEEIRKILDKNKSTNKPFTIGKGFSKCYVKIEDDKASIINDRGDISWNFSKVNIELFKEKETGDFIPVSLRVNNMGDFAVDLSGDTVEIPVAYRLGGKKFKFTSLEACEDFVDFEQEPVYLGCFENSNIKFINIPENITKIGPRCFANCIKLQSATMTNVESIGSGAFENCKNLTSIELPETLKSIHYEAFGHCTSLTSITIPKSVIGIDRNAFTNCENLTSVTWNSDIPLTEELIRDVFANCPKLKEIISKDGKIELDKIIKNTDDPSR